MPLVSRVFPQNTVGRIAEVRLGKMLQPSSVSSMDMETPYLRAGHLSSMPGELPMMWASARDRQLYGLIAGDVLVAEGGDVGRVEFAPPSAAGAIIQNSLHRLRARSGRDQRYLSYCLEAIYLGNWLEVLCNKSTFGHLTVEKLSAMRIPDPEVAVQCSIADYLDNETARIDALITKKQQMIELLDERFQVVGRGLLTDGMPEDGLYPAAQWSGPVPRSWRLLKVGSFARVGSGTTPPSEVDRFYGDNGVPWVTTAELRESEIKATDRYVTAEALREHSALKVFPVGTVLVAMYGATIGRVGILGVPATTNQACCAIFDCSALDSRFVYWWLSINRINLLELANGAGQPNISQETIRSLRVPAPELAEQQTIASKLESLQRESLTRRRMLERQIELLRERRQALITAAVTGELEIPGVAV